MSVPAVPLPSFDLSGRRALVTGGSRGIGLEAARVLAAAGAHVTIAARGHADAEAAAAGIRAAGGDGEAIALDVTDLDAVTASVAGEPFDVLINSAGTNRPAPFVDVTVADFDAITSTNLRSAFFVTQAVVRRLLDAGRPGSIVHISSQMGQVGAANRTVYCATKWALEGLTRAMAIELAPHRIRVNTLAPTFIETPMTAPFLRDKDFRDDVLRRIKLGRLGRPEDLAGAVLFLASEASSLMTGATLLIDGGWTAD